MTPDTSTLANQLLRQSLEHVKTATPKTHVDDLTPDEKFAILLAAGVPMRTERDSTNQTLRLTTIPQCALERRDNHWHVIIHHTPNSPPFL